MADEGPIARAVLGFQLGERDDLVDDAWQFQAGLGTVDLQLVDAAVVVVDFFLEDADEPDIPAARVLQVREPSDHLLAEQPVGAATVRFAGLLRVGLRLALTPLKTQAPRDRDRVDEDGLVLGELGRIAVARADCVVMRLAERLVVAQRRVWAADEHGNVTAFLPGARTDGVAGPALDGQVTGLQVHEQSRLGIKRPQLRGLADAGLADQHALDAAPLGQPLISGDDRERHHATSFSCTATAGFQRI